MMSNSKQFWNVETTQALFLFEINIKIRRLRVWEFYWGWSETNRKWDFKASCKEGITKFRYSNSYKSYNIKKLYS